MPSLPSAFPQESRLAESIADGRLKARFCELIRLLSTLHEGIEFDCNRLEVRVSLSGSPLCRLVPYRELIHVQVGESPAWEIRVRDENAYIDACDRILEQFLGLVASKHSNSK